ncbi:Coatomer subunit beta [Datura stramonium]|uniref:Coatomer subunit beta n=1 Tax=Datura stramonium TaxID=4076 RepID=A0ABS8S8U9_DATST|nr:Coatomer subunit beta [Datura stramonium]
MGDLKLVERPQELSLAPESSKQIKANISYISPAVCSDAAFKYVGRVSGKTKVAVNTVIQDEKEFLDHIIRSTNMKCPPHCAVKSALEGECGFLAANLYAKSVFGEDALVNVSIEKQADSKLSGYIRIRSKTQGIALSRRQTTQAEGRR